MSCNAKYCIPIIILTLFLNSCKKGLPNQPNCTGNCVTININGNTSIKTSSAPLPNVPVDVTWIYNKYCILCATYKVASGKTDNDGKFNFNVTIDSTFFKDFALHVRVPTNTNYISVPFSGSLNYVDVRFYEFTPSSFQNIKFDFYPKTYLTIRLHRTLTDNFDYFSIQHQFTNEISYNDYFISGPQFAKDTTLKVVTSADTYTKLAWQKTVINGQSIQKNDSLLCTSNGANVFDINY